MKKIEKLMSEIPMDIDAVMITSDINRRYFSGMKSSDGVILAFHEKAYLIIDFRYIEKAREVVTDCDVILQSRLSDQLQNFCKEHNVKKIAVEADTVTISALDEYKKILPKVEFDTKILSEKIKKMRIIKTPEEILKIKSAQKIAENAFDNVLNFINVGKTEKEIAFALDSFMLQNGAEALSFDTIALAGKNTSLPHGVPSDKKIQNGDFVLMDFGAVFDGYHSDMTRTVCVGAPTAEMARVYETVLEAQRAALAAVHAGVTGEALDKAARDVIIAANYGQDFGHSLGHGVGMEIHELPNASPRSETILQENMIVTIEPGIYLLQKFGVRIEDFVIITQNNCENITKSPKNLISL